MIATVVNRISKGVQNLTTSSNKFTWFKTNFNMPMVNYGLPSTTYVRAQGSMSYIGESTSYDLTGFVAGYEICNGVALFNFENDSGSSYNINTLLYVKWRDPSLNVVVNLLDGGSFVTTLPAGFWTEVWYAGNIGCAFWEVASSGTYHFRSQAVGTPNIALVDTSVTMSNVPSTSSIGTPGYIWVEGNNLCYITGGDGVYSYDYHKQTMVGVDGGSSVGSAGYMWIDTSSHKLCWIGSNGHKYTANWCVKQFASFYTNSATGATFAGTSKAGFMWVDREFGQTHLAYIGSDGYKYLTGGGDNPYA